jgi:hypothetical protein
MKFNSRQATSIGIFHYEEAIERWHSAPERNTTLMSATRARSALQ